MKRLLLPLLVLSLLAAACGDDDDTGDDTTSDATDQVEEGAEEDVDTDDAAFPVTVEHRYGETTFDEAPQRIVSLDMQWTDVLLSMDGPLVGVGLAPNVEGGVFPWQEIPDDVEQIETGSAIPYEAVAALRPDLIVVTYFAPDEATYDRLAEIAPTVALLGDEQVDAWEDIAATAGDLLGTPEAATALVEEADARNAELAEELSGLEGKDYALANYVPNDGIYVVADPDDGASQVFAKLGLEIDPDLLAVADGASGRAKLSLEQVGMLDSDLLFIFTNGADTSDIPGFDNLPAVESGAVATMTLEDVSGLNTPSPLSVPYALDVIRPALEAAAGA